MTIASASYITPKGGLQLSWGTELNSTSATALERKGSVRWEQHPIFGLRGFKYVRFDAATTAGQLCAQVANTAISNITSGTTTTITTSGLTADIHVDGILYCIDDAGGAGAAPEGESGVIVANTATLVTIATADAFSVAPAANDDFQIHKPWAVDNAAANDTAWITQGVALVAQDQYDYGWVQFYGLNPQADVVAAGTALPVNESLIAANSGLLTDGAGAALDLRVASLRCPVASDQVVRKALVFLFCGEAYNMGTSTS